MPLSSALIIVAFIGYALYRQSRRHEIVGATRFKLAIIYGIVGIAIGGYHVPGTTMGIAMLVGSLLLSAAVGLARGLFTRVWAEDGRVYAKGTALSIGLFVALVLVKVVLGFLTYLSGRSDTSGIGEIVLMMAIMVAFQAELLWRRAKPLGARQSDRVPQAVA